ncbi:ClpXP protease specificity-enhancing factor [Thalassotalea piscium]
MTENMTSTKPYIVRAFYDWISDNQLTPYIVVDVSVTGVMVPMAFVNDGQIILNISSSAVGAISMLGEQIEFSARFAGKLEHLVIPYGAVAAIYAKENGAGTQLPIEHPEIDDNDSLAPSTNELKSVEGSKIDNKEAGAKSDKPRPSLKVIK